VHPGTTRTEKTVQVFANQAREASVTVDEIEKRHASTNSSRRIIDAQEIAYVVAFLASPKSVAINGDVIAAGGGVGRSIYY
jgi:NAD(P)-dependent dehydrogenase (short-subunit alcohol dehydrogenase family)